MILLFRYYSFDAVLLKLIIICATKVNFNFIFPEAMKVLWGLVKPSLWGFIVKSKQDTNKKNFKKLYSPFLWMGLNCLKAKATSRRHLTLSSQKFLVLTLPTPEGWKAESTLEPPSGFELGTPGLGIQRLTH